VWRALPPGFPIKHVEHSKTSDRVLHSLGGNAFSGSVVMAVVVGILVHMPAFKVARAPDEEDMLCDASDLLELLSDV